MRRAALLAAFVLFAVAGGWFTGARNSAEPPSSGVEGGRTVRVRGTDGGPVPGARADYYRPVNPLAATRAGSARGDRRGDLVIPAAPCVAVVEAEGFAPEVVDLGPDVAEIRLRAGTDVEGLVVDLEGRPVAGARVFSPPGPVAVRETATDAAGRFDLGRLPENAVVRAEAAGYAPLELSLRLYPDEGRELVFYLVRGRLVAGRVLDSRGGPVPGAWVELDQECLSLAVPDAEGRFAFPGVLADWEVLLTPRAPGYVGPTVSPVAGQAETTLRLFRPAEVRGEALDAATREPVPGLTVRRPAGEAGPRGTFRAGDLPPGEVKVELQAGSLVGEATLTLREGEVRDGIVVPMRPPRWGPPEDLRPSWPVRIRAVAGTTGAPAAEALVTGARAEEVARTGPDGVVVLRFPPGRNRVRLGGPFDRYAPAEVAFLTPDEAEVPVALVENRRVTLDLNQGWAESGSKFWLRHGEEVVEHRITGRSAEFFAGSGGTFDVFLLVKGFMVVSREGARVPEDGRLPIFLYPGGVISGRCLGAGGHPLAKVVAEVEEDPLNARTETAGDGVFRVGGLIPGAYHLLLYARNIRTKRIAVRAGAEPVDLGDVPLLPPCEVSVGVVDSAGRPIPGAVVESALLVSAKAATDGEGQVSLPGRNREETLRVHAEGYLDAWPEVSVPDDRLRVEVTARLFRPARLLVRVTDRDGRPVSAKAPGGLEASYPGPGEVLFPGLAPGPFEVVLTDREGRTAAIHAVLVEGEDRVQAAVVE